MISLLLMVSGVPVTTPLALANYPEIAGAASSLLGLARFAFGGLAAPLVGLGGATTAVPLGIVTVTAVALGAVAYLTCIARGALTGSPISDAFALR